MKLGLYLRLSKEDGDWKDESNSITNQRYILHNYIEKDPELCHCELQEYVDDGYSGKNFHRPGIQQLLEDIKNGKINGVIVKDFSRFGRNYIEVGNYLEKIFPLCPIRFISVNNDYDSDNRIATTPGMNLSFQNLMYDYYSEENSLKIKSSLAEKRSQGNYLVTFAPYGYRKAPENPNHLIIDEEAAEVVRFIFETYKECGVKAEVARALNRNHIKTPQEYAGENGAELRWKYENRKKLCNGTIVGRILKNPVYIGHMVYHKREVKETGSGKRKNLPKQEWKICENTHEPIVSKELFEWVNQEHPVMVKKISKKKDSDSPIKGLVKCGGCRHHLVRRNRKMPSYYCRYYYEEKIPGCCSGTMQERELIELISNAICDQMKENPAKENVIAFYQETKRIKEEKFQKEEKRIRKQLQRWEVENFSFYEMYCKNEIAEQEYRDAKQKNIEKKEIWKEQLAMIEEKRKEETIRLDNLLHCIKGERTKMKLTKEIADQLISSIYIYDDKTVELILKSHYCDPSRLKSNEGDAENK